MAITNYLVHFKTEATYKSNKSQLRNDAVAFVKDATIIHTHGTDYYCGSGPVALESDLANYATTSALTSGLASKANTSHTHSISQISGLQGELDSKLESVSLADLGITATAAEINKLDGLTATTTELNYVDGVTSNIQTQLNNKAASSHNHSAANITSGTLDLARIPSITDAKITSVSASKITGTIPQANLPSYVDDVLEYSSKSSFPQTGEAGKIYVDTTTNLTYRWGGSAYVEISPSLALGETSSTAYRGDKGKTAYDHSQATGNPHNLTLANLGINATAAELNYVDGVTSNIQTQLNGKAASSHNHNASNINAGTLNIARIPTGTSATTVALGNHTHSGYLSTEGGVIGGSLSIQDELYVTGTIYGVDELVLQSSAQGQETVTINQNGFTYNGADVLTSANYSDYIALSDIQKAWDGNSLNLDNASSKLSFGGSDTILLLNSNGINFDGSGDGSETISIDTESGSVSLAIYSETSSDIKLFKGVGTFGDKVNATNGFYETSDARLKNFKDDIKALDVVSEIPTKYFTWKEDENQESQIGTSAQEVEKLYPELVSKIEDDTLTVDYAKLSIIALAAIKELKAEVESLKGEIWRLKSNSIKFK